MIARELISKTIAPLDPTDTVKQALTIMHINYVKHLPITKEDILLGVVSEEELLRAEDEKRLNELELTVTGFSAREEDHLFEVLSKVSELKISTIPVLDQNEQYLGLITQEDLLHFYADSFSFKQPGSILVLEVNKRSYSLSEISRIVEMENAAVLSTFLHDLEDSANILVTLKINVNEIQPIIKSFERYDYVIRASFAEQEYLDNLKERYDLLMSYLNV